jgi:hypothetical protein
VRDIFLTIAAPIQRGLPLAELVGQVLSAGQSALGVRESLGSFWRYWIFEVLTGLIEDAGQLAAIGQRFRRYLEKYYSIPALVERLHHFHKDTAGPELSTGLIRQPRAQWDRPQR